MEPTTQGNVIQIKRGPGIPPEGALAPYELGFDTSGNQLYIGGDGDNAPAIQISGAGGGGGASGATFFPTVSEDGVISWTNDKGLSNPAEVNIKGPKGETGAAGKSAYATAQDGGYTGTEEQFANKLAETPYKISVKEYGAEGNGSTDDTAAFKAALAENRTVYVPGGTYVLSDTILINDNCELELSQDTVLKFTQVDKHGIAMRRLAHLKGNHATIFVPYTFTKNVIHAATDVDSDGGNNSNVPPFTTWDPQWKYSRYVTDINICKRDSAGFCYSTRGECSGTGLYIGCDVGDSPATYYMWGVSMSGVRIQGAFTNGIHVNNIGEKAWNHDMRLEAVIDACETGVLLERTNIAHIAVTFQPRASRLTADGKTEGTKVKYAKWGIKLVDSKWVDLTQSTIWDWHLSLGADQTADQSEYQHIAMYGDCTGLILGDFLYHIDSRDIRDIIYSENDIQYPGSKVSNLATMTILQEPITRWFKTIDGAPYYFDGSRYEPLTTSKEFGSCFVTEKIELFTNALPTATDLDGSTYGYRAGYRLSGDGSVITSADNTYTLTGFIPVVVGQTVYVKGMFLNRYDDVCRFYLYDANKNPLQHGSYGAFSNVDNLLTGASPLMSGTKTEEGFQFSIKNVSTIATTAYVRFNIYTNQIGDYPIVSVGKPIEYSQVGALAETIKVTDNNIESTKLNTLQTRVNNVEQSTASSIAEIEAAVEELETEVDGKISNISITTKQADFILPGEGEDVVVPDFTNVVSPFQKGKWWNASGVFTDLGPNIYIEPKAFAYNDHITIRGIDFTKNWSGDGYGRIWRLWKDVDGHNMGDYGSVINIANLISSAASGTGGTAYPDIRYDWDASTSTLQIFLDQSNYTTKYLYAFGGPYATGYNAESIIMTVNEEIDYRTEYQGEPLRFIKELYAQNVVLTSPNGTAFELKVGDDGTLTATQFVIEN